MWIMLTMGACFQADTEELDTVVDSSVLQRTVPLTNPMPLIDLEDSLRAKIPMTPNCPTIHTIDNLEIWQGDCELQPGHRLEGELRFEMDTDNDPDSRFGSLERITAENLHYTIEDETVLFLDGQLQFWSIDRLLRMDSMIFSCGLLAEDCEDPMRYMDMVASLYPSDSPTYDLSVSGMIITDAPVMVDGTWHVDPNICPTEPSEGILAVQQTERYDMRMDGSTDCDGCATWKTQGRGTGTFCTLPLE